MRAYTSVFCASVLFTSYEGLLLERDEGKVLEEKQTVSLYCCVWVRLSGSEFIFPTGVWAAWAAADGSEQQVALVRAESAAVAATSEGTRPLGNPQRWLFSATAPPRSDTFSWTAPAAPGPQQQPRLCCLPGARSRNQPKHGWEAGAPHGYSSWLPFLSTVQG